MWQGLEGHDAIVDRFRHALAAGRLATTYLFVGPEGVGKRTLALRLAQALLCTENNPALLDPCGTCESCRLSVAGNHPDLDVVSLLPGKRQLAIRQFVGEGDSRNREGLCHSIAMRPKMGRRRVAIIDDADWFTSESANCLLKTLEEPPPGAVIILIGTSRSRQLPTILSRSQVVRFAGLPPDVVSEMALAEGWVSNPQGAAELARRSGGSLTRARELADAALWQMRDRLLTQWNAGAIDPSRLVRELEEFIKEADKEADKEAAGKEAAGKEAGTAAELRRQRFRQLLSVVSDGLASELRQAEPAAIDSLLGAIDRTLEAEQQLDRNANQSTLLESWINDLGSELIGRSAAASQ